MCKRHEIVSLDVAECLFWLAWVTTRVYNVGLKAESHTQLNSVSTTDLLFYPPSRIITHLCGLNIGADQHERTNLRIRSCTKQHPCKF